jgi:hypothetical protein
MIGLGVSGKQTPFGKNQSQKMGFGAFANADFRRDLDLSLTSTI